MIELWPCNAWMPVFGRECGDPGRPVRSACVHEHVRDRYCCDFHLSFARVAFCRACHEIDGHECPVTIIELAGRDA